MEIPKILKPYEEFLMSTVKPSNQIVFTLEETKPWESKLGGCPYLEDIGQYPMGLNGSPMMFFAQINLAEMPSLPDFPQEGLLQFYVEDEDCYGLDAPCVVKYIPAYTTDESALVRENPYSDAYEENLPFTEDCKITFVRQEMFVEQNVLNTRISLVMCLRKSRMLYMISVMPVTAVWEDTRSLFRALRRITTARNMCCFCNWTWTIPAV